MVEPPEKPKKLYISLNRNIVNHCIFKDDAEFFRAWVALLVKVNHSVGKKIEGDKITIIDIGETLTSEKELTQVCMLSRKRLQRFLKILESDNMISVKKSKKGTRLKVHGYRFYQNKGTTEEQQRDMEGTTEEQQKNNEGTTEEQQRDTNNKKNKDSKKSNESIISNNKQIMKDNSLEVYENYISIGQSRSYHKTSISIKHITKLLKTYTKEQLIEYANNYRNSKPDENYLIACSNFYGTQERFMDFKSHVKEFIPKVKESTIDRLLREDQELNRGTSSLLLLGDSNE